MPDIKQITQRRLDCLEVFFKQNIMPTSFMFGLAVQVYN